MSDWITLFDELDRVYKQTARLLTDADQLMSAQGYTCAHKSQNQMGLEISGSLQNPGQWYPRWLARFYSRGGENAPIGTLGFVAVFLSDQSGEGDWTHRPRMTEPLIVAGSIEGHPGEVIAWFYWVCKWWFWLKDARPDGTVLTYDHQDGHRIHFKQLKTFAIPLAQISSIEGLNAHVIVGLMTLLKAAELNSGGVGR